MMAKAAREQVQAAVAALDDDHHDQEMMQEGSVALDWSKLFYHAVPVIKLFHVIWDMYCI